MIKATNQTSPIYATRGPRWETYGLILVNTQDTTIDGDHVQLKIESDEALEVYLDKAIPDGGSGWNLTRDLPPNTEIHVPVNVELSKTGDVGKQKLTVRILVDGEEVGKDTQAVIG